MVQFVVIIYCCRINSIGEVDIRGLFIIYLEVDSFLLRNPQHKTVTGLALAAALSLLWHVNIFHSLHSPNDICDRSFAKFVYKCWQTWVLACSEALKETSFLVFEIWSVCIILCGPWPGWYYHISGNEFHRETRETFTCRIFIRLIFVSGMHEAGYQPLGN